MPSISKFEAAHLARRTGFAATEAQVSLLSSARTRSHAVSRLLKQTPSQIPLPQWADNLAPAKSDLAMRQALKKWWIEQMLTNTAPLQERMVLFWHNHFTSSLEKVKWAPLMLQQNILFRKHALGSFRKLLLRILKDPAMLIYLDNTSNRKEAPNENLARELLELFTLGEGKYSEKDIRELARALTGASVNKDTGKYQFYRDKHDSGDKSIFTETAPFLPNHVADLILRQDTMGRFIVEKLWREFIGIPSNSESIDRITEAFKASGFRIRVVLKLLLLEDAFWDSAGTKIKSPIELVVGSYQMLDISGAELDRLDNRCHKMGQDIFNPPSVKGWPGGNAWYSSGTIYPRQDAVKRFANKANKNQIPEQAQLLATPAVGDLPPSDDAGYLAAVMNDPAYQVC